MTKQAIARQLSSWHRIIVMMVLCLFGICASMSQRPTNKQATPVRKTQGKSQTVQSKPGTTQNKSKKTAKSATKYEDNRVYLLHSDNLHYDKYRNPTLRYLTATLLSVIREPLSIVTALISTRNPTLLKPSTTSRCIKATLFPCSATMLSMTAMR